MAFDFPNAPTIGQVYNNYTWDGEKWAITSIGGAAHYASDTPPAGALDNSIWLETDTGITYFRYNDGSSTQWISVLGNTAPLDSPIFTGNPQAPTPSPGDNDNSIATTGFVTTALNAVPVDGSAWASTSAFPTFSGGGSGTGTVRYKRIGKTMYVSFQISCTVTGGFMGFTLPFPCANTPGCANGFFNAREVIRTGLGWCGSIAAGSSAVALNVTANNTAGMNAGDMLHGAGFYEAS
jgi:hypothetical protein